MDSSYSEWRSQQQLQQKQTAKASAIPLFAPEEPCTKRRTTCRMVGLFSSAQWQELELQCLIYKYMMAGASVPLDLVIHLKRAVSLCPPPCYYHYQHHPRGILPAGWWGDAEPGRCRRTDGKKWRCSRDVVAGQKYCERHVHRGRNRSRKHVEIPTPPPPPTSTCFKATLPVLSSNQGPPDAESTDGRVLMRFFDDWPRSHRDPSNTATSAASDAHRPISIPENRSSADFSLTLSTGNNDGDVGIGRAQPIMGSWLGWGSDQGEASMGGPLAEALRSSASAPSPTSVLQKHNAPVSETSSATA